MKPRCLQPVLQINPNPYYLDNLCTFWWNVKLKVGRRHVPPERGGYKQPFASEIELCPVLQALWWPHGTVIANVTISSRLILLMNFMGHISIRNPYIYLFIVNVTYSYRLVYQFIFSKISVNCALEGTFVARLQTFPILYNRPNSHLK